MPKLCAPSVCAQPKQGTSSVNSMKKVEGTHGQGMCTIPLTKTDHRANTPVNALQTVSVYWRRAPRIPTLHVCLPVCGGAARTSSGSSSRTRCLCPCAALASPTYVWWNRTHTVMVRKWPRKKPHQRCLLSLMWILTLPKPPRPSTASRSKSSRLTVPSSSPLSCCS